MAGTFKILEQQLLLVEVKIGEKIGATMPRGLIYILVLALLPGAFSYAGNLIENSIGQVPTLNFAPEATPVDANRADLEIHFDEKDTWPDYEDSVLPETTSAVRAALASTSMRGLTFHDLADPTTFERVSPSAFLAFLMTGRIVLPSGTGNEVFDDSVERSLVDKEYERMMQVGYARYKQVLATDTGELQRFMELVDIALSNSTALGQKDKPVYDFQGLERPVAIRVDQLISHVLDLSQFHRLYVKRRMNSRADCVDIQCNDVEFAKAFFSPALTDRDRNLAALMDRQKSPAKSLNLRKWLDICIKALAFKPVVAEYGTVLRFAGAKLTLARGERVFPRKPTEQEMIEFLELTRRLVQLGSNHSPEDTTFASVLLLHAADQSVMLNRAMQRAVDEKFDEVLAEIPRGEPLDLNLREKIRLYVRSKEWHGSPDTAPITVELLREAIIHSNRTGRPLLDGLKLTRSCSQILFTRRDGTRRF